MIHNTGIGEINIKVGQIYFQLLWDSIALPLQVDYCESAGDRWINIQIFNLLISFMFNRKVELNG